MPLSASLSLASEQAMDLMSAVKLRERKQEIRTKLHVPLGAARDPLGTSNSCEK